MNAGKITQLWDKAISIIDLKLLRKLKSRRQLIHWLHRLGRESADGERLVICLAIDFAYGAYPDEKLDPILKLFASIDVHARDARHEFAERLKHVNDTGMLNCVSRFCGTEDGVCPSYAVVMRIEKLIYCLGAYLFKDTPSGRERLQKRISRNPRFRLRKSSWWTHDKGIVWLTDADELRTLLAAVPSNIRATSAKNALGIAHPNIKPETPVDYVLVEYSSPFGQLCCQPTALDAWWKDKGQYYLSWHEDDNWGRAQNCVPTTATVNLRERVHHCCQGALYEFTVTDLGSYPGDAAFAAELASGRGMLRTAAYNRLESVPAAPKARTRSKASGSA